MFGGAAQFRAAVSAPVLTEEMLLKLLPHSQSTQTLLRVSGVLPWDRIKSPEEMDPAGTSLPSTGARILRSCRHLVSPSRLLAVSPSQPGASKIRIGSQQVQRDSHVQREKEERSSGSSRTKAQICVSWRIFFGGISTSGENTLNASSSRIFPQRTRVPSPALPRPPCPHSPHSLEMDFVPFLPRSPPALPHHLKPPSHPSDFGTNYQNSADRLGGVRREGED